MCRRFNGQIQKNRTNIKMTVLMCLIKGDTSLIFDDVQSVYNVVLKEILCNELQRV